jgi:hypothetical protein
MPSISPINSFAFQWKVSNPGEHDAKVDIGEPPLLGNDGILYGVRVSPDGTLPVGRICSY